jgi:hypothetical protein
MSVLRKTGETAKAFEKAVDMYQSENKVKLWKRKCDGCQKIIDRSLMVTIVPAEVGKKGRLGIHVCPKCAGTLARRCLTHEGVIIISNNEKWGREYLKGLFEELSKHKS